MDVEISLSFGREVYSSGGICTALLSLKSNRNNDTAIDNAIDNNNNTIDRNVDNSDVNSTNAYSIYIQSFGHIQVDSRWIREDMKQCNNIFKQEFLHHNNDVSIAKLPKLDNKSYYVFVTSRKKYISPNCNDEICVYFDLPDDLLPSYKGLCAVISYYIAITVLNQNTGEKRTIQYPYQVVGKSSVSPMLSYPIRNSDLAIMPSSSWPNDLHLQPLPDMLSVGFDDFSLSHDDDNELSPVVYNIRDEDIVCSLTLLQNKSNDLCIKMYPYEVVCLTLDFHLAKQKCNAVRSRLIQYERKSDGSRVQDKVLYSTTKSTKDALTVHMQLQSPPGLPCEFITPVFKVCYMIELEFLIEKNGVIQSEPFTWNIPVEIMIPTGINNVYAEINACMEAVVVHRTSFEI